MSKSADPDQTLRRRRGGWSGSTLFAHVRRTLVIYEGCGFHVQMNQLGFFVVVNHIVLKLFNFIPHSAAMSSGGFFSTNVLTY